MKGSLLASASFFLLFSSWLLIVLKPGHAQEKLANARCNDYPDRGICEDRGFTVKWYYDRFSHRCREFYYGGCGGNNNRFDNFEDCTNECHSEVGIEMDADRRCHLPHDPGNCWGDFQRWAFDSKLRKCVCSTWSGCGGNANRFYSYEHCMSVCGKFTNRDASNASAAQSSPEQLRNAHSTLSEMNKQRMRFFTAAPVQTLPIGHRNLFVSGNDSQIFESGRIIFTGLPSTIYTRILPSSVIWHIRADPQLIQNGTLSTKQLFHLQQILRHNQLRSQSEQELNVIPPQTKAINNHVSADRINSLVSSPSTSTVLSPLSQTPNDDSLSDQQRAHLEQRKWKQYTQEQTRIREENHRRQLEAIRKRQQALNLYRYNQQYPLRSKSRTSSVPTTTSGTRSQQPSKHRNNNTSAKHNYPSTVQLLLRTQHYQEDNRTPKLKANYEMPTPSDDRESRRNLLDSEVTRRFNLQPESIRKSEAEKQYSRQIQRTDIANETPHRVEPQTNQERPQENTEVIGNNSALYSASYDARQLQYYRQLQEYRRRYLEQIRERQLRERETELRRREYLIRSQSMSEKARAIALERLKQQQVALLPSSSPSASSSLPPPQSHINTLSYHPKTPTTAIQQPSLPSHQQPKRLHQQERFQPQRETSTFNYLDGRQLTYGKKKIGSWLDSDSQRSYLKQYIHVHQFLPTTTTTTTSTSTAATTSTTPTMTSTPPLRPSSDSEEKRTEVEIRRALTKARKRARLEKLKKLERMMGIASSSEMDYEEAKMTPTPSLRTNSSPIPTAISIISTTTTTPKPIIQRLEVDSDRMIGRSKTDHSWLTVTDRNRLRTSSHIQKTHFNGTEDLSPGLLGPTQTTSTSESSIKLDGEIKKSAEKVMQGEEGVITSKHVIRAEKKEEPMNLGKQIISLDDYDENEMIEEDYDVDEYGKRITNNQTNRTMIKSNQHDIRVLVTSPDPQLEPYIEYLPNASLPDGHLLVYEDNNSSLEIITLPPHDQEEYESINQLDSDWLLNTITSPSPDESSESTRSYNFTFNPNLDGSITGPVNSTDELNTNVAEGTTPTATYSISSTSAPVNVAEQDDLTLEHSPDKVLKPHNGSLHSKHDELTTAGQEDSNDNRENTTSLHSNVKEDSNDLEDDSEDDSEDLFFWKPEYENKRLQMIVSDTQTDDESDAASQSENAFRIKIHNREVLAR